MNNMNRLLMFIGVRGDECFSFMDVLTARSVFLEYARGMRQECVSRKINDEELGERMKTVGD